MTSLDSILNTKSEFGGFIPYDYADPSTVSLPYDTVLEEVELFFLPNSELDCLQPVNYKACFFGSSQQSALVSSRLIIADRVAQVEFWSTSCRLGTFEIGQDIIPNNEREIKSGHCRFIMSLSLHSQPVYKPSAAGNNPINNTMISLIRYIRFYLRSESDLRDAFCAAKRLAVRSNDEFTIAVIQGGPVLSYLSCLSEDAMTHTIQFEQSFLAQSGALAKNSSNLIDRQKPPPQYRASTGLTALKSSKSATLPNGKYDEADLLAKKLENAISFVDDRRNTDVDSRCAATSPTEPRSPSSGPIHTPDTISPRQMQRQRPQLPQLDLAKARKLLPPTFSFIHKDLQMYIVNRLNSGQVRVHQLTFQLCRALSYAKSVQGFRAAQAVVDLLSHDSRVQFTNIDAVTIFILQNEVVGWGRLRKPESRDVDFSNFSLYSLCQVSELRDCGVRMSWVSLATLNDRECEKLQLILKQTLNRPISPTYSLSLRKAARHVVRDIVAELQKRETSAH